MRFMRFKVCIKTAVALFVCFAVLLFVRAISLCKFSAVEGNREFYLHSPSSQSRICQTISLSDAFIVRGESVRFSCVGEEETLVFLLNAYDAQVLFTEEAGGVRSYYCITPKWIDGICINGVFVNLHIAFDGELGVLGAPLIFGGF